MEMVFSPLALIVVVVFGLFVLGGIAVVVMLLANSKTRVVGAVLLTIGLLLAAVFGVAVLRYRAVRYDRRQVQEARVMIEMERAAEEVRARESAIRESEPLSPDMNEETPVPEPAAEPAEEVEPTEALGQVEPAPQTEPEKLAAAEDAPVANEDAPVASEKPDKSGNVLRAMARALGKALGDARKQTKGNVPADGGEDSASDVSVKTEVSPATVESEPAAPETEAGDDEAADDQAASETAEEQPPTIPDDREPAAGPGSDETTKTGTVIPAAATPEVAGQNVERPAWVGAPAQRTGDGYRTSVTVGPYMTRQECERALPAALQTAVAEYVDVFIGPRAARRVRLSPQYVTDHVVRESWEETVTVTLDPNRVCRCGRGRGGDRGGLGGDEVRRRLSYRQRRRAVGPTITANEFSQRDSPTGRPAADGNPSRRQGSAGGALGPLAAGGDLCRVVDRPQETVDTRVRRNRLDRLPTGRDDPRRVGRHTLASDDSDGERPGICHWLGDAGVDQRGNRPGQESQRLQLVAAVVAAGTDRHVPAGGVLREASTDLNATVFPGTRPGRRPCRGAGGTVG